MAVRENCIGILWTNTVPNMPPWGGREARLGNNPVVFAVPNGDEAPVLLDVAVYQRILNLLKWQIRIHHGEWIMELIVPLNEKEGYNVKVEPAPKNQCRYTFYKDKTEIKRIIGKQPIELTTTTSVWKQIQDYVDPKNYFSREGIKNRINNEILPILQNYYHTIVATNQELAEEEELEKQVSLKNKIDDAEEKLKSFLSPADRSALTAGERNNILLCFLAYCSQVILKNPISVIALGEAGSGKSHIEEVALSLIPKEFVVNEKNITANALFRRAEQDVYFYDGKIVNYGDMGGSNDQNYMEESKNLMKELVEKINAEIALFQANANLQVTKGNKAAGTRARKNALEISKLMKEFRKASVEAAK